jgi:hypothetical protein
LLVIEHELATKEKRHMKRYRLEKDRNGAELVEAKRWPDEATYMHTPEVVALLKRVLPHVDYSGWEGASQKQIDDAVMLHAEIKSIIGEAK